MADRKIGSVKAAISSYEATPATKKVQPNFPEKSYTKTGELHQAKRDTSQFYESRKLAESVTAEAESKLAAAKKTVKDLTLKIEESDYRVKAHMMDLEKVKMAKRQEEEGSSEDYEFARVLRELESIKRDLSKLKLDMASIMEERRKADKETEESVLKMEAASSLISTLTKKVEEVDEEHVLVELARIEAVKEYKEIQARKKDEEDKNLALVKETERRKYSMIREMEEAKKLEKKLAVTTENVHILDGELKQLKEIGSIVIFKEKSESASLLDAVMRELEDAKKELEAVKDEGIQFMASMDVVRNELGHIMEETARLRRKEGKAGVVVENISTKLIRAKSKLEATSAAEDRAKAMASNLSSTLEHIRSEIKTAKTERALVNEETATINAEIQKADADIELAEEILRVAVQDLKAVKASEAIALENLKEIIESTIRHRAPASQRGPTITVSKFEYEYLKGHAAEANEIADKKVAAAQAWVVALKASEREIMIKTEQLRRESRELKVEKQDTHERESPAEDKAASKSFKLTPARRLKSRKPSSPIIRFTPRSSSTTTRRRQKVISNLSQIFTGKGKNQQAV